MAKAGAPLRRVDEAMARAGVDASPSQPIPASLVGRSETLVESREKPPRFGRKRGGDRADVEIVMNDPRRRDAISEEQGVAPMLSPLRRGP